LVSADYITIGVSRRWQCGCSQGNEHDAGLHLNFRNRSTLRPRIRLHPPFDAIQSFGKTSQCVKNGRSHQDFAFHPPGYGIARWYPLAQVVFRSRHMRLLTGRTLREKKACVESAWSKSRRHPAADIDKSLWIDVRAGLLQQFS